MDVEFFIVAMCFFWAGVLNEKAIQSRREGEYSSAGFKLSVALVMALLGVFIGRF